MMQTTEPRSRYNSVVLLKGGRSFTTRRRSLGQDSVGSILVIIADELKSEVWPFRLFGSTYSCLINASKFSEAPISSAEIHVKLIRIQNSSFSRTRRNFGEPQVAGVALPSRQPYVSMSSTRRVPSSRYLALDSRMGSALREAAEKQ